MWQSVIDAFTDFSVGFEGKVYWPYLDTKNLVTVGVGNLIDPVQTALGLPWVLPDGSKPTQSEIAAQWRAIKARPDLAKLHFKYAASVTSMRLTDAGIAELVKAKLLSNAAYMTKTFPNFAELPADFQLFASSIAWAAGPGWTTIFSNCTRLLKARKFALAAQRDIGADGKEQPAACEMNEAGNPGLHPRNIANRLCLRNAQAVIDQGADMSQLFWPGAAPNASQRDEAIRTEAELALANHVADYSQSGHDVSEPDPSKRDTIPPYSDEPVS